MKKRRLADPGRLYEVENEERKFGSAKRYLFAWVSNAESCEYGPAPCEGEEDLLLLFTDREIEDARDRAKKNEEDLLEKKEPDDDEDGDDGREKKRWRRPFVETILPTATAGILLFFVGFLTCPLGHSTPGPTRPPGGSGDEVPVMLPESPEKSAACKLQARDLALRAAQLPKGSQIAEQACEAYRAHRTCAGVDEAEQPLLYETLLRARNLMEPDYPILLDVPDCMDPEPVSSEAPVRAVAFASDGKTIAAGGDDGRLLLLDVESKELRRELPASGQSVRAIAWSAAGNLVVAYDGMLRAFEDPLTADEHVEYDPAGAHIVGSLAFDAKGTLLAMATSTGQVGLWKIEGGRAPGGPPHITFRAHADAAAGVAFNRDGTLLAVGSPDGATLWEVRVLLEDPDGDSPKKVCDGRHVRAVAFDDEGFLACGDEEGSIELWDPRPSPARKTDTLWGHRSRVSALGFSSTAGATRLASSSLDGSIRLWTRRPDGWDTLPIVLSDHDDFVWTLAFSPDGSRLISGSEDRTVRVWEARSELLAEQVCRQPAG